MDTLLKIQQEENFAAKAQALKDAMSDFYLDLPSDVTTRYENVLGLLIKGTGALAEQAIHSALRLHGEYQKEIRLRNNKIALQKFKKEF